MTATVWRIRRPRKANWRNWLLLVLAALFLAAAADECGNDERSCTQSCPNSGACNRCDSPHW